MKVLLDADVLIGALDSSDAHHEQARNVLVAARGHGDSALISAVDLTEVLIAPAAHAATLTVAREAIRALGVSMHRPSEAIAVEAARLRGRHPISLPDAYLLATSRHVGAAVATFDRKVQQAAEIERLTTA